MLTVGLTGSSGSGKGYVSEIMNELGIPCLDTDVLCRQIYLSGQKCYYALISEFGRGILSDDGEIDRKKLFDITFGDSEKYGRLNDIAFLYIRIATEEWIEQRKKEEHRLIVIDAPMLYESGFNFLCDCVICVISEPSTQIRRIMDRDGITETDARKRLSRQKPNIYYTSRADYVLNNSPDTEADIDRQTRRLVGILRAKATRLKKKGENKPVKKKTDPQITFYDL